MNYKNKKSCQDAEKENHTKSVAENVAYLVLILSLVAVHACSIRWESSQTKLEIDIKPVDSIRVDTIK